MIRVLSVEEFCAFLSSLPPCQNRPDPFLIRLSADARCTASHGLCRLYLLSDAKETPQPLYSPQSCVSDCALLQSSTRDALSQQAKAPGLHNTRPAADKSEKKLPDNPYALLGLYGGTLTLFVSAPLSANARQELVFFIQSLGSSVTTLLGPRSLLKKLSRPLSGKAVFGHILCLTSSDRLPIPGCRRVRQQLDLPTFYELLCRADGAHAHPSYDAFYCDAFYRRALPLQLFVAEHYGLPVGCLGIFHIRENEALISDVAVLPEERRRGVATDLVSQVCRRLLEEGQVPCLLCRSPAAAALYRKLGFRKIGSFGLIQLS